MDFYKLFRHVLCDVGQYTFTSLQKAKMHQSGIFMITISLISIAIWIFVSSILYHIYDHNNDFVDATPPKSARRKGSSARKPVKRPRNRIASLPKTPTRKRRLPQPLSPVLVSSPDHLEPLTASSGKQCKYKYVIEVIQSSSGASRHQIWYELFAVTLEETMPRCINVPQGLKASVDDLLAAAEILKAGDVKAEEAKKGKFSVCNI